MTLSSLETDQSKLIDHSRKSCVLLGLERALWSKRTNMFNVDSLRISSAVPFFGTTVSSAAQSAIDRAKFEAVAADEKKARVDFIHSTFFEFVDSRVHFSNSRFNSISPSSEIYPGPSVAMDKGNKK